MNWLACKFKEEEEEEEEMRQAQLNGEEVEGWQRFQVNKKWRGVFLPKLRSTFGLNALRLDLDRISGFPTIGKNADGNACTRGVS